MPTTAEPIRAQPITLKTKALCVIKTTEPTETITIETITNNLDVFNGNTYFAITLSSNKTNFPGSYSGCHALISGIHVLDKNIYKKFAYRVIDIIYLILFGLNYDMNQAFFFFQ